MIYIDFETYSECNLKKYGAWIYSKHPSTEILCMAYKIDDGKTKIIKGHEWPSDPELDRAISHLSNIEAHNAFFEYCIWRNVANRKYKWPKLSNKVWRCSAARCAAYGLPRSLEKAAIALNLKKQKDMEGHRIMMKLSKPRKPTKNNKFTKFEKPIGIFEKWLPKNIHMFEGGLSSRESRAFDWFKQLNEDYEKLYVYCIDDVETEYELSQTIPELPKKELWYWKLDQKINQRGVGCDTEMVQGALDIINILQAKNNKKIQELTNGEIETTGQRDKILKFCEYHLVFMDDLQAETVTQFLKKDLPKPVKEILNIRQESSLASVKKLQRMVDMVDTDKRIRETIRYYGAERTGRWAGSGIQPQNFPRKKINQKDIDTVAQLLTRAEIDEIELQYGSPPQVIKKALRPMLCATNKRTLISADYSAIEYCVLMWMTNTTWAINSLNKGESPYFEMASDIFGIPKDEIEKGTFEYFLGKETTLGFGYGMGENTFYTRCDFLGNPISKELSLKCKQLYREKHWAVVQYWKTIESAVKNCLVDKSDIHLHYLNAPITIEYAERTLNILLPSGRRLYYHEPKLKTNKKYNNPQFTYMGIATGNKWTRIHTWGGKLTENIDQAMSRDILAHAMLNLEKAGYPVVLTVHDEIVCEVEKEKADLKEFRQIMCDKPKWAQGLPINVDDGWIGKRFRKA